MVTIKEKLKKKKNHTVVLKRPQKHELANTTT